jgi:NDP-sugar pyrophosphorylase family protein
VHANRQGEVTAFIENEDSPQRRSAPDAGRCEVSISGGVYLFERRFIESIPPFQSLSLERDVFPRWVGRGLYAYRKRARFIDIGTPESYAEAPVFFQRNSRLSLGVRRTGWFDSKRPA